MKKSEWKICFFNKDDVWKHAHLIEFEIYGQLHYKFLSAILGKMQ